MTIVISILLVINLLLLLNFYMHMFQLNSYFFKKYLFWIKGNIKKVFIRNSLALLSLIILFNNDIVNILSIIILICSIIINIPKSKAKIPLKYTSRVIRMITTVLVIGAIIYMIWPNIITLIILNIVCIFLCVLANTINYPIEYLVRKYYINDAKKILNNMPNLIVIGITGSYGKTGVKNYLSKTLGVKYNVLATPKNYNTTMGVVKTIREELKPIHEIFICEMGATKLGDIKEICDIVKPKFGVITSIGPQHMQSFKTIDNVIRTKFELYDAVKNNNGITFLNFDNEYIAKQNKDHIITYGIDNKKLDYNAYNLVSSQNGLEFTIKDVQFKTKLIGKHNVENLAAAIAVANHLGVPIEKLVPKIREINSVEHRLELISRDGFNIIDDSYNSNPVSSKSALDTLNEFKGTKIIVTPGLIELGDKEEEYNKEFGEYMTDICDYIFIVNSTVSKYILEGIIIKKYNKDRLFIVNSPGEAIKKISNMHLNSVTILLENDLPDNYNL